MKIKVNKKELINALKSAKKVADFKGLPILGYAYITVTSEGIRLTATDLEVVFRQDLEGEILEVGAATLPIKDTLARLPLQAGEGVILLVIDDAVLLNDTRLGVNMPDEYPPLPVPTEIEASAIYPAQTLATGFRHVFTSAATEDKRPILTGVNWNGTQIAAADSYRLSVFDTGVSLDAPPQYLNVLARGLDFVRQLITKKASDICVTISERWMTLQWDVFTVSVTRLEGRFPDYVAIKPRNYVSKMVFNRQLYADQVSNLSKLGAASVRPMKIRSTFIEAENTQVEIQPVRFEGEELACWLDSRLLADTLQYFPCERVTLQSNGHLNPVLLLADNPDTYTVIMPCTP